jgi:hypothetical protein
MDTLTVILAVAGLLAGLGILLLGLGVLIDAARRHKNGKD